ncbi:hypothetical protein NPIL_517611, partial [Nephila pilipes]
MRHGSLVVITANFVTGDVEHSTELESRFILKSIEEENKAC